MAHAARYRTPHVPRPALSMPHRSVGGSSALVALVAEDSLDARVLVKTRGGLVALVAEDARVLLG